MLGKGRGHKGKSRHYTTEAEVEEGLEKARRQKEWQVCLLGVTSLS